jgi:hypothetical protein
MTIKLEEWSVVRLENDYFSPEQNVLRFAGHAYNHPKFDDGHPVITTCIVGYKNGVFITRSGSQYELGVVDPDYEKVYPNALERVRESGSKLNP